MGTLGQIAAQINALEAQVQEQAAQEALYEGAAAYFVPWGAPHVTASTVSISAANVVGVSRFYLPMTIEVANMFINVGTVAASSMLGLGIYNYDGTALLLSGTASSATSGIKTIAISPAVILGPGLFLLAWTCSSGTPTCTGYAGSAGWNLVANATNAHHGTAAEASASGILPATTGAITGAATNMPIVKLEGA